MRQTALICSTTSWPSERALVSSCGLVPSTPPWLWALGGPCAGHCFIVNITRRRTSQSPLPALHVQSHGAPNDIERRESHAVVHGGNEAVPGDGRGFRVRW